MGSIGKTITKAIGGGSKASPVAAQVKAVAEVAKPEKSTRADRLAASMGRAAGGSRGQRTLLGYNRFTDEKTTLGSG